MNASSTIFVGAEFLGTGSKVGVTYTYGYSETRTTSVGEQKLATLTLSTPTVCFYMNIDVYMDAAFGTYITAPTGCGACTEPHVATGTITDASGNPVAGAPVSIQTNAGPVIVFTGADGTYRLY